MWNRTDLAMESRTAFPDIEGVKESKRSREGVTVSLIEIETEEAAKCLEKPRGRYITIECPAIAGREQKAFYRAAKSVATGLAALMKESASEKEPILVLGLGNRFVTPDALGPKTIEKLFVTRQIAKSVKELAPEGMREVAAIAPGVLGVTGIETLEVARGIVKEIRPGKVICIDALASRQADRITTVIQLNDSGILPGAGVNNRQQGLNQESLGIPVIAMGVPTVVFASTIVMETLWAMNETSGGGGDAHALFGMIENTMREKFGNMIVTPKDVDMLVEDASSILAQGINEMLHGDTLPEIHELLS
ncbi:MAG: GPR endopeptidase [Clostridia bacterium]|nr:GPR endopeptidase [Clostridia bacterium]